MGRLLTGEEKQKCRKHASALGHTSPSGRNEFMHLLTAIATPVHTGNFACPRSSFHGGPKWKMNLQCWRLLFRQIQAADNSPAKVTKHVSLLIFRLMSQPDNCRRLTTQRDISINSTTSQSYRRKSEARFGTWRSLYLHLEYTFRTHAE